MPSTKNSLLLLVLLLQATRLLAQPPAAKDSLRSPFPDTVRLNKLVYGIYLEPRKIVCGFINPDNDSLLFPPQYDYIEYRVGKEATKGLFLVQKDQKWGLLDFERKTLMPTIYDQLNYNVRDERYYVRKDSLYGILRRDGSPFIPIEYTDILSDGHYFKVQKGGKWGLLNMEAKEILPTCFQSIKDDIFLDNTLLQVAERWTVLRWVRANPCTPSVSYQQIEAFNEFFLVKDNNRWGLVDSVNKEKLPTQYLYLAPFFGKYLRTLLVVNAEKKMGLTRIDSTGALIEMLPLVYDEIWVDEQTLKIKVRQGKFRDYIYEGKPYLDLKYNDVTYYDRIDGFAIKSGKVWGLANSQGKVVVQPQYDKIYLIDGKNFVVQKKGKYGVINGAGSVKIPIEYEGFQYKPEKNVMSMFLKKADMESGVEEKELIKAKKQIDYKLKS